MGPGEIKGGAAASVLYSMSHLPNPDISFVQQLVIHYLYSMEMVDAG